MEPPKIQFIAIVGVLILMTGCVTDGNQYTWGRTTATSNIEQERAADDSMCMAKAYEIFNYNQLPSNICVGDCVRQRGFSAGVLAGTAARQSREIRKARDQFYENCMISKGWQRQPIN